MSLKYYQVGENDIVKAENPSEALDVFSGYVGKTVFDELEFELDDVVEVSPEMELYDEDEQSYTPMDDFFGEVNEPKYLFGWE